MRGCVFNAKESIEEFNKLRLSITFPISSIEFRKRLKSHGILSNNVFFSALVKSSLVVRISNGYYKFAINRPIHYTELNSVYLSYRRYIDKYNPRMSDIDRAIKLLKENGYMVLKEV